MQRLREAPCNWWKDMGQTHPEEWPLDSGCPVVVSPGAGGSSGAASVSGGGGDGASGSATDTDGGGGGGGGKLVLGLVAVVIIGALVSRAKLMNRVSGTAAGDASIYKEGDGGGSEVLPEETL